MKRVYFFNLSGLFSNEKLIKWEQIYILGIIKWFKANILLLIIQVCKKKKNYGQLIYKSIQS